MRDRAGGGGVAIGIALGIAFGAAMGHVGAGLAIGLAFGVALGAARRRTPYVPPDATTSTTEPRS